METLYINGLEINYDTLEYFSTDNESIFECFFFLEGIIKTVQYLHANEINTIK